MTSARPTSPARGVAAAQQVRVLGLLALAILLVAVALAPAPASAAEEQDEPETTPLTIALTSMSPGQVPRKGDIRVAGTVTNDSEEDWSDINVAPFVASSPITSRDELAEASASAADVAVGDRLTDAGTYVAVGDLAPGERASFRIRIPVESLGITGDPGVYWIGVHALGSNVDGRDAVADGRVRTFIPLVAPATARAARRRPVPVSVVLPLRDRARRAVDGSLNGPARWAALTGPSGRLTRLADFGASAGDAPLAWLVDPAVVDALEDFSDGNPPLSLGSPERAGEGASEAPESPSEEPSPSAVPSPVPGAPTDAEQERAGKVLDRFLASARTHTLFRLGYSDPDTAALARRRPALVRRADELAARRMSDRDLSGSPAVAPPGGRFDPELLPRLDRGALMLLGDGGSSEEPTLSRLPTGQDLVLVDERASSGGPAPTSAYAPLAVRQRILSEAALEASTGEPPRPIVVGLPPRWNPGPSWRKADFFDGLQTGWSQLAPVPRGATTEYDGELPYSRAQRSREIAGSNVAATRSLTRTSEVLDHLLANVNDVTGRLTGAALQASSYNARRSPALAARQVRELDAAVRDQISAVQVTGTDFVTLSGGSGSLTVTLVNDLQQPVTVGLQARTPGDSVRVEAPEPVSMQPGERTTLRLQVNSDVGVHDVTLYPVTVDGEAAGTPFTFSLRTSQVGRLIWYIIIAGGTLLAVMIVRRIVLRIRDRRWRPTEVQP